MSDHVLAPLRRHWVTFLLVAAATAGGAAAVTYSLPDEYETSALVLVAPAEPPGSDHEAAEVTRVQLATYAELFQATRTAHEVAVTLPYDTDAGAVQERIAIRPVQDTHLLRITAEGRTPQGAVMLADTYARVAIRQAAGVPADGPLAARFSIAEPASQPAAPIRPRRTRYLGAGGALALLAGAMAAAARHRLRLR